MPEKHMPAAKAVTERWETLTEKMLNLAAEFPDDRLDWVPTAGSRSCGSILRHVAFWNDYLANTLNGEPSDGAANEISATDFATKNAIMNAVAASSKRAAAAVLRSGDSRALQVALPFVEHNAEHYGQLSVCARLLGIIPPASRG